MDHRAGQPRRGAGHRFRAWRLFLAGVDRAGGAGPGGPGGGRRRARFTGTFNRDLPGSDFLHWGEGTVSLSARRIVHDGRLAPGPDYKLYLVDTFVNGEFTFLQVKDRARLIGDVKSFDGFVLDVPAGVDIAAFTTVVVWCEAFSEFITAAQYR